MKTFIEFLELKEGDCIEINTIPLFITNIKKECHGIIPLISRLHVIDINSNKYIISATTYDNGVHIFDLSKPTIHVPYHDYDNHIQFERKYLKLKDCIIIENSAEKIIELKALAALEVLKEEN